MKLMLRARFNCYVAQYLRSQPGWVAFYLEEHVRECGFSICWLKAYEAERQKEQAK